MPVIRMPNILRTASTILGALALTTIMTACPRGDVGAPCNHGSVSPPPAELVTFPALSCNDLLCVYANDSEAPQLQCTEDSECDDRSGTFACDQQRGVCELDLTFVLNKSMCSKRCTSEADCEDGGITDRVLAAETKCDQGFTCQIVQSLGQFCCRKLCICKDDFNDVNGEMLQARCEEIAADQGTEVDIDGSTVPRCNDNSDTPPVDMGMGSDSDG
ncbi:MAG: hypothetical protein ACPG77_03970 [Nannocystaceae bacterium]